MNTPNLAQLPGGQSLIARQQVAGIDGKGGIYFAVLLCAGPYVTSCAVNGGA